MTYGIGACAAAAGLVWGYYQWKMFSMLLTPRGKVSMQPGKISAFLTDVAEDLESRTRIITAARAVLSKTKPEVESAAR